jgi:hypothetical protein
MPITQAEAVDLLTAMVRIESVTPWLIPTGSGENVRPPGCAAPAAVRRFA